MITRVLKTNDKNSNKNSNKNNQDSFKLLPTVPTVLPTYIHPLPKEDIDPEAIESILLFGRDIHQQWCHMLVKRLTDKTANLVSLDDLLIDYYKDLLSKGESEEYAMFCARTGKLAVHMYLMLTKEQRQ